MAEIFEMRRHSIRGEGKSLSPEGIALAERVAPSVVGNHQACYSSPKRRARETLEAFGVRAYKTVDELSTLPDELEAHEQHAIKLEERAGCTRLEAYLAIPATHLIVEAFGNALFAKVRELGGELRHGKNALAVSHGGSIEAAVLAAMPDWGLDDMGGELAECEGVRFVFSDTLFRRVEIVRL